MKKLHQVLLLMGVMFITACVTINVYFPAAEVEDAASEIVNKILGDDTESENNDNSNNPQSSRFDILSFFVSSAHAEVNINISSPSINDITSRMKTRYEESIIKYLNAKVVGFSNQGFIEVIDDKSLPLKERQVVKKLVADDNRDRRALYRELAVANGHPEWEQDIQNVFVKEWVGQARSGWMYQNAENVWVSK